MYKVETDNGTKRQHLAVFQLTTDKSMFVTTSQEQKLQVVVSSSLPSIQHQLFRLVLSVSKF